MTFINDSTRKVWVYFSQNKSNVFATFKKWKAVVELETNSKVKYVKSDNIEEYVDSDFKQYCTEKGIKMMRMTPGTPQQNGVAERMNRTLNERARSMWNHSGLPKTFWTNAINTVPFFINRRSRLIVKLGLIDELTTSS